MKQKHSVAVRLLMLLFSLLMLAGGLGLLLQEGSVPGDAEFLPVILMGVGAASLLCSLYFHYGIRRLSFAPELTFYEISFLLFSYSRMFDTRRLVASIHESEMIVKESNDFCTVSRTEVTYEVYLSDTREKCRIARFSHKEEAQSLCRRIHGIRDSVSA